MISAMCSSYTMSGRSATTQAMEPPHQGPAPGAWRTWAALQAEHESGCGSAMASKFSLEPVVGDRCALVCWQCTVCRNTLGRCC